MIIFHSTLTSCQVQKELSILTVAQNGGNLPTILLQAVCSVDPPNWILFVCSACRAVLVSILVHSPLQKLSGTVLELYAGFYYFLFFMDQ